LTDHLSLFYVSGDGQEAMPGAEKLPKPLLVGVTKGKFPIEKARIRFRIKEDNNGGILKVIPGTDTEYVILEEEREIIIETNKEGIAGCVWTLDTEPLSQQVEATLLSNKNNSIHGVPIFFNANLSIASQVAYDPANCSKLKERGTNTVQDAIDNLCKMCNNKESGIHIRSIAYYPSDKERKFLLNDKPIHVNSLFRGLRVLFNENLDANSIIDRYKKINLNPVCFVTLYLPYPLNSADIDFWGGKYQLIGYQPIRLSAEIICDEKSQNILWKPTSYTQEWLENILFKNIQKQYENMNRILARLTLKGNFIWGDREKENYETRLYLDGNTYGKPVKESDNTFRTGLEWEHSGDNRKGGDFEMWFWLIPLCKIIVKGELIMGKKLTFEADDPEGIIVNCEWDFGDGNAGNGKIITHNYEDNGEYTVLLTVHNKYGLKKTCSRIVTIKYPEEVLGFGDTDLRNFDGIGEITATKLENEGIDAKYIAEAAQGDLEKVEKLNSIIGSGHVNNIIKNNPNLLKKYI
jgi:hypothetical protein